MTAASRFPLTPVRDSISLCVTTVVGLSNNDKIVATTASHVMDIFFLLKYNSTLHSLNTGCHSALCLCRALVAKASNAPLQMSSALGRTILGQTHSCAPSYLQPHMKWQTRHKRRRVLPNAALFPNASGQVPHIEVFDRGHQSPALLELVAS